jgi:hypothetical protein
MGGASWVDRQIAAASQAGHWPEWFTAGTQPTAFAAAWRQLLATLFAQPPKADRRRRSGMPITAWEAQRTADWSAGGMSGMTGGGADAGSSSGGGSF